MKRTGWILCAVGLFAASLLAASFHAARPRETQTAPALPAPTPPPGPLVVLDAGHGGFDGGSVGKSGTVEASLNLAVAQKTAAFLREAGYTVVMTRETGAALGPTKREDFAARRVLLNTPGAAACVSIHMNAFPDAAVRGPMAFYMRGSAEGEALASAVIAALCAAVEHPARPANPGDYFVVRECACPAVLVECGFLSNAEEEARLQDPAYQERIARGVAEGVGEYLSGSRYGSTENRLSPKYSTSFSQPEELHLTA